MNKTRIVIWPFGAIHVIFVLGIAGVFILGIAIFPFWMLIANEPLEILDIFTVKKGVIQFFLFFPISMIGTYMYVKAILFRVSFTDTHIIVPKISEVQEKRVDVECNQILTCEATMQGLFFFFIFHCADGKKRKMFITRFSFKQLERILVLIKERGGLIDQDINKIINPLRIKKKT